MERGVSNDYGRYAGLGLQFVASIGLFGWFGYWLDGKLSTYPLLLIAGIMLGATGGFISLIKNVSRASGMSKTKPDQSSPGGVSKPEPPTDEQA